MVGVQNAFEVALFGALAGGSIAGFFGFSIQRWRYKIDRWTVMTDEYCREIINVADIASEFWLKSRNNGNKDEMAFREIRIKGGLARLDALRTPFDGWWTHSAYKKLMDAHGEFIDATTGGDFTAMKREAQPETSFRVQQAAAEVVLVARNALKDGDGWAAWWERRSRKRQD